MWPFKRKAKPEPSKVFQTVICIPGMWNSWDEFVMQLPKATNGEYVAAGQIIMHVNSKRAYQIEFCEKDFRMQISFAFAGKDTGITKELIAEIENHNHVIYLSGDTGSLETAKHIAFAAGAILKAGGIGIKIETAGKAFEKEKWLGFLEGFEQAMLYHMFVVDSITNPLGEVYSCGMQNLGFKDTIVGGEEPQKSVDLIRHFGYYQIVEKPAIQAKETFSLDEQSPKFRVTEETDQPNIGDELFENPFGMWRLSR